MKGVVVLPIVVGNPKDILANYPLLRDKSYRKWEGTEDGVNKLVDELKNLVFLSHRRNNILVPIHSTVHSVSISPDCIFEYLSNLDSHLIYNPNEIAKDLLKCGFLVDANKDNADLVLNGIKISAEQGVWGDPGIGSLELVLTVFRLIAGKEPTRRCLGRGFAYREVLGQLRDVLEEKSSMQQA
jgi:hypothetical protein